jgi:WD40 repeat protein
LSHNPFADVIGVGLDNGHIKLYDERTLQVTSLLKKSQSTSKVDGHTNRVFCINNHPHNPHEFVSAGWDNTLQVDKLACFK